jgi:flagellar biosynthesis/type III secretory pathway ATPase
MAAEGHYPAIDVLQSVSRLMPAVASAPHQAAARRIKELMATYANARDLINIGAYVRGSDARIDRAIAMHPRITAFLRQTPDEPGSFEDALTRLSHLDAEIEAEIIRAERSAA